MKEKFLSNCAAEMRYMGNRLWWTLATVAVTARVLIVIVYGVLRLPKFEILGPANYPRARTSPRVSHNHLQPPIPSLRI